VHSVLARIAPTSSSTVLLQATLSSSSNKLFAVAQQQQLAISRHPSPRGGFLFHALRFFEIARVLVRLDHVARSIALPQR